MNSHSARSDFRTANIAILDDDPHFCQLATLLLETNGHSCRSFSTGPSALDALRTAPADVLLLDHHLGEQEGTELIAPLRSVAPDMEVLFVTASSSPEIALDALRLGAFDFLTKPLDETRLIASITKAVSHGDLRRRVQALDPASGVVGFEGIVGASPPMQTAFHIIENVAPTEAAVMVRGESGTGKELAARAVHARSKRRSAPFVALNMAALPAALVESTLFGHEKGAFTGATARHEGACEEAAGGTLFLDEICEMPIELQAKMLRFLQERVFRRVGGSQDIRSDVRIVSATNRDPLAEVAAGRFREDLYYRLNVVPVELPRLGERGNDIELLIRSSFQQLEERHGRSFRDIEPSALEMMRRHPWPGNVRELLHVLERIAILNDGPSITAAMLPHEITGLGKTPQASTGSHPTGSHPTASPATEPEAAVAGETARAPDTIIPLDELERRAIEHALRVCEGSVPKAAQALQVSQATIYRRLESYGIDRKQFAP